MSTYKRVVRSVAVVKLIAVAILTLLIARTSHAQEPFPLLDASKVYRLDNHVQVLFDSSNSLTIDQVSERAFQTNNKNLTFGYQRATIWLKVVTYASSPDKRWYLEIPAPFLEYVDFYQRLPDGKWEHTKSGYFRKHSEQQTSHTSHVLRLKFSTDSVGVAYIQIAGTSPKTFTLKAIEERQLAQQVRQADLGYGIFFGILLIMLCYNIYLFATLRKRTYFIYILVIALTLLILSTISGYGGKFVWPEKYVFNYLFGKLAIPILIICVTLYTISFLHIKRYSSTMYRCLVALIPLSVVALLLIATGILGSAGNHLITLATVVFIVSGIVAWIRGNKMGIYFVVAWSFYFLGGFLLTLRNSGVFNYSFLTTHFVEIGAILGVMFMGFGLGAQYRRLQKEKEAAQRLAYQMQQEDTARLERKVKERTEQLDKSNRELQKLLEKNKQQTQIIEEKNAELDSFFYRISHDLKGPILSSLGLMTLAKLDVTDKVAIDYIDKETAQLKRLNNIITGLVNLARLNNVSTNKEEINFDRMVDECIASLNHIANFSRVRFEKDIRCTNFRCEWTLVTTILQNLIENSIKYARGESPCVKIRVFEEDGQVVVIEVEDNGLGISPQHYEKIFELFYRATGEGDGSGLGLYILKRAVDRLKGTIKVKSEVGVGTTFTVRLPIINNVSDESSDVILPQSATDQQLSTGL